jgi:hypothetical protein
MADAAHRRSHATRGGLHERRAPRVGKGKGAESKNHTAERSGRLRGGQSFKQCGQKKPVRYNAPPRAAAWSMWKTGGDTSGARRARTEGKLQAQPNAKHGSRSAWRCTYPLGYVQLRSVVAGPVPSPSRGEARIGRACEPVCAKVKWQAQQRGVAINSIPQLCVVDRAGGRSRTIRNIGFADRDSRLRC